MLIKEVKKLLDNTKVYVNGKSEEIQKKLFSLGYYWASACIKDDNVKIRFIDSPFIYIIDNQLYHGCNMENFKMSLNKEITVEDILSIILEPEYRPFKNVEECWEEIQKHNPLGWIRRIEQNEYLFKGYINENVDYEHMFNEYIFVDGAPFGIKEEE